VLSVRATALGTTQVGLLAFSTLANTGAASTRVLLLGLLLLILGVTVTYASRRRPARR
jgi:hypothetical protein